MPQKKEANEPVCRAASPASAGLVPCRHSSSACGMSALKTWVLLSNQAQGSLKGRQDAPCLLRAGDGPWLHYSRSEVFGFAQCLVHSAVLIHLLWEVLSERVVTIKRQMAFASEGPFCSQDRGERAFTCRPSQLLGSLFSLQLAFTWESMNSVRAGPVCPGSPG